MSEKCLKSSDIWCIFCLPVLTGKECAEGAHTSPEHPPHDPRCKGLVYIFTGKQEYGDMANQFSQLRSARIRLLLSQSAPQEILQVSR